MTTDLRPLVSVVIPAYNVGDFIGDTLASVFAQRFRDFEVIVVNDGSTDSPALVSALEPYRHRIEYLEQANAGPSAARNAGIRQARGEYVAFLDGDDMWLPECLSELTALAGADPSVAVLHGDAEFFGDPALEGKALRTFNLSTDEGTFVNIVTERYTVATSCSMARRDWCMKVELFDVGLRRSEDYDLWLRIAKAGGRFSGTTQVLARYRRHAGGASANVTAMLEAKLTVVDKCARTLPLTAEEREASTLARRRQQAEKSRIAGKRALAEGDVLFARRSFREANAVLRSPKLTLVVCALTLAPRLFARFYPLAARGRA